VCRANRRICHNGSVVLERVANVAVLIGVNNREVPNSLSVPTGP
jgi:hypothetical protein